MVTLNIETEMDVANGTRGEIVDIVLSPEEDPIPLNAPKVRLKKMPAYVLVKLNNTRLRQLPHLPPQVIPIEPNAVKFSIMVKKKSRTITRRQFPITAAYTFTDYRAQGQTIRNVIVDISTPPYGGLNLFNLYVALSRGTGRGGIRLLREFDHKIFFSKPLPEALVIEDSRLQELNRNTQRQYVAGEYK